MFNRLRKWHVVLPFVLIALLMATAMGMVWHHHSRSSTDVCTLCHLVIAPAAAGPSGCELMPIGTDVVPGEACFHSHLATDEMPARAPPA